MILSHRHRFIFIHTRKVAGTSITAYLNRFMGPDDLQLGSWKDTLASGGSYNKRFVRDFISPSGFFHVLKTACIYTKNKRKSPRLKSLLGPAYKSLYSDKETKMPLHRTAYTIMKFAPREWEQYFKFCFVRNPYARAVSDYNWRVKKHMRNRVSFTEFLERVNNPGRPDPEKVVPYPPTNWEMYTINDQIAVDYIGRLENILDDMQEVCSTIGIEFRSQDFPHARQKSKSGDRHAYRQWYSDYDRELAYRAYRKEIDHFGYEF